jgi:MbtH protein
MLRADNEIPTFKVVVNHQEHYSIYPAERRVPLGWRAVGKVAEEEECLRYIEENWINNRPANVRERVEALREEVEEASTRKR